MDTDVPAFEAVAVVKQRIADRLDEVDRVVAVMSGKGGVGKSAVAVNLALALAQRGQRVGIFDADLNGPSVAQMLGLRGQPVRVDGSGLLLPIAGPEGLAVQSMDFFLQGNQPLDWDGPAGEGSGVRSALEQSALVDLLGQTLWGKRDVLVLDVAPGADRLPALSQWLPPSTVALAVAIPTQVAMLAVERSLRRAFEAEVPVMGLVENLGAVVCQSCGAEGPLFRDADIDCFASDLGVDVVARIPFDANLARAADTGQSFLAGEGRASAAGRAFCELAERVLAYRVPEFRGAEA